jgi:hypothetical protein
MGQCQDFGFFPSFVVPPLIKRERLDFLFLQLVFTYYTLSPPPVSQSPKHATILCGKPRHKCKSIKIDFKEKARAQ